MNLVNSIGLLTVFLLVLLSLFLLTHSSKRKVSNVLFACFLLVTSFDISALFLQQFYAKYESINLLRVSSSFLPIPLFYLYVKKACFNDYDLKVSHLLHGIPFIIFTLIIFQIEINFAFDLWYTIASQLQYYGYMIGVFYTLSQYKRMHLDQHSFQNETYKWLMTTSILFLVGNSLVLFRGVFEALNNFESLGYLNIGISFFALCVITWFVLKTMSHPALFSQVNQEQARKPSEKSVVREDYEEEIATLDTFMIEKKPFLDDTLSLQSLSDKTNIPAKHLSFLINQIDGKHFFDYVNKYRIEEAKKLLKSSDLTIQQIMYEVGFNSKSSFNTAFKKQTSTTPSSYRKEASNIN